MDKPLKQQAFYRWIRSNVCDTQRVIHRPHGHGSRGEGGLAKNSHFNSNLFRSLAYSRKGSLEGTFFPSVRMSANFCKIQFFGKLNYGTPHMTISQSPMVQVNRKWTECRSEVKCEGSTRARGQF